MNQLYLYIKQGVPNIPDEVINIWLLPFAQDIGWPPDKDKRWGNLLCNKSISFWNNAVWKKEMTDLSQIKFSRNSSMQVNGMYDAYVEDKKDFIFYPALIETNGGDKSRFLRILFHIVQYGVFPQPPVISPKKSGEYEILDGSHRFTALIYAQKVFSDFIFWDHVKQKVFLEEMHSSRFVEPSYMQEVWVCKPNW